MDAQLHLDPNVLLRQCARDRNVDLNRALTEAVRAGLSPQVSVAGTRFIQPTYHLGSDRVNLKRALALAAELEDEAIVRKLKSVE